MLERAFRKQSPPVPYPGSVLRNGLPTTVNRSLDVPSTLKEKLATSGTPTLGLFPEKPLLEKYTCTPMFIAAELTGTKT